MSLVDFTVVGLPATKGSTKSFRHATTGRVVTTGDCERTKPWQRAVAVTALAAGVQAAAAGEPVSIDVIFALPRPKRDWGARGLRPSAPRWHLKKPDVDKLLRAVLDALTGVAYVDDAQVFSAMASKRWCVAGEEPRAMIRIATSESETA